MTRRTDMIMNDKDRNLHKRWTDWESQHKYLTWYVAISCTIIVVLLVWRG